MGLAGRARTRLDGCTPRCAEMKTVGARAGSVRSRLMGKPLHVTKRLSYEGAVDADGHILEPPDLWETHLEPKFDAAVLSTTIGLLWEAELDDAELSQADTRAYNRWICEFGAGSPRLVPTADLSLSDPAAAAKEISCDPART